MAGTSETLKHPNFRNPSMSRVASIDIGTNTILLLIAQVEGEEIKPLVEVETIVRLGEGLQKNGVLSREAMERGLRTLSQYLDRCRQMEVQQILAVGTSALREAGNSRDFLEWIERKLHIPIEVISGEEEAHLSFLSVARDLKEASREILVVDVGGGSTEFILGKGDQVREWMSLPIGSVRFTEQFLTLDPVREEEWGSMEAEIRQWLVRSPRPRGGLCMVAVGGTATTLASVEQKLQEFIPERIHHFTLTREALRRQLDLFRSKPLSERRKIPGLPPARADVILAGGAILSLAMEETGCPSALISCHGIRYGLLYKKLSES
jgi:exopolyphosphatase/guanosine-5'-triphosphate,3'-diphosphate pyrophosphatase